MKIGGLLLRRHILGGSIRCSSRSFGITDPYADGVYENEDGSPKDITEALADGSFGASKRYSTKWDKIFAPKKESYQAILLSRYGGPEVLSAGGLSVQSPRLEVGQVKVSVAYAGLNMIDTYHRSGFFEQLLPYTLGVEGSGTVLETSISDTRFQVGDRVCWFNSGGSYAERATVKSEDLIRVPDGISLELAACLPVQGITAICLAQEVFPIRAGHSALITAGAGGTGNLLVQMAKLRGATTVIATVSDPNKADEPLRAGADHVIVDPDGSQIASQVRSLTGGEGVDVAFDSIGKATYMDCLASLKARGYYVLYGNASGVVPPIDPQLLSKFGSLYLTRPSLFNFVEDREARTEKMNQLFAWCQDRRLNVRVAGRFPLAQAAEAHTFFESRNARGKILLEIRPSLDQFQNGHEG